MDELAIEWDGSALHIAGFPHAAKVVRVTGPKAGRLGALALHHADLKRVASCLSEIPKRSEAPLLQEALWDFSIVVFMKCFRQAASRFALDPRTVYSGNDAALAAFAYFKALRDKHIVHDENDYSQAHVGAIINGLGTALKVAKIMSSTIAGYTLESENLGNLELLTNDATAWVVEQFDALAANLTTDLEAVPHHELLARDALLGTVPDLEAIARNRIRA